MSPCLETHFRLHRVASAMQLSTDAKKPVPRADFLAERIPSDIFNLFSKFCPQTRKSDSLRSIQHLCWHGKLCLLHRHGNKGVELCSVSRQTPWNNSLDRRQRKDLSTPGAGSTTVASPKPFTINKVHSWYMGGFPARASPLSCNRLKRRCTRPRSIGGSACESNTPSPVKNDHRF
jgi:hypothetical protein